MKRKNKLKWLTMSVVALGAISVVPIITTSCSNEKELEDYSDVPISEAQYQEQADTIANINAAIEAIENGTYYDTYGRTISDIINDIRSYKYFNEIVNFGDDIYNNDGSYNNSYISSIKKTIYDPFENKNVLLSYDQYCIVIDLNLEYRGEENTLEEEDYYAYWIQTNIDLIAFLDNKENLLLLPYFYDWGEETWDYDLIMFFVHSCINWEEYFFSGVGVSWNFTNYFSNYLELVGYLY